MKYWIILIVLAVALTAATSVVVPMLTTDSSVRGPDFPAPVKPDGPAPKLVINEDTTWKFTVLGQQTKGKHEWTFKNEGPGLLEVRGASVTCSCTTSDLFDGKNGKLAKIPPGESKQITVTWDTKKFEGNYRQVVTIATNDPAHPTIDLVVQGTVKQALVTIPSDPAVAFMNVSNDEPTIRKIIVTSPDRPETKITSITSSKPELITADSKEFQADEDAKFKVQKGHWIDIKLLPSPNLGEFNEEVVVETDHPLRKAIVIKVKGKVVGPITIFPDKVEIHEASSIDGGSQDLTIVARARSNVNFTVDKKPVGMDVTITQAEVSPEAKGSKYLMKVKLLPGHESGLVEDEIVIKSDDPKASEIRVPVSILVKGTR